VVGLADMGVKRLSTGVEGEFIEEFVDSIDKIRGLMSIN
jgi:hypothetical protein